MKKEKRQETAARLAEKFSKLSEPQKAFIAGYMARIEEDTERERDRKEVRSQDLMLV